MPTITVDGPTVVNNDPPQKELVFNNAYGIDPAIAWQEYQQSMKPPVPTRQERRKREVLRRKAIQKLRNK